MQIETTRKLFSADEYYQMAEAGILAPDERTELINGEIIEMSPAGNPHISLVDRLNALFAAAFYKRAIVRVQSSLRLNDWSVPEPDVVLLKYRADFYKSQPATIADILLLVEVSHSSLNFDRKVKLPLYTAAGIPEVWIESVEHEELMIFREPFANGYAKRWTVRAGDSISIAAFPGTVFTAEDIFG